jgi:predicted dehydrogenase
MVSACEAAGIPFGTGNVVGSNNDYNTAYELARSGEIGQVLRINLYDSNGQMGTHGFNICRKFADRAQVEFVMGGMVSGDPFAESEDLHSALPDADPGNAAYDESRHHVENDATGAGFYGGIGGYIRFANGIEAFSSYETPGWRGIEVVGTEGMITTTNNTSVGLRLFKRPPGAGRFDPPQEVDVGFETLSSEPPEREIDDEGWQTTSSNMRQCVDAIVRAVDSGEPLQATTGDDMRHALEIAIALRESARRDGARVTLPLTGAQRHVRMLPEFGRWNYKKRVHGEEWYREAMNAVVPGDASQHVDSLTRGGE